MNTTESETVWMASNTIKQEDRTKLTVQGKGLPGFFTNVTDMQVTVWEASILAEKKQKKGWTLCSKLFHNTNVNQCAFLNP